MTDTMRFIIEKDYRRYKSPIPTYTSISKTCLNLKLELVVFRMIFGYFVKILLTLDKPTPLFSPLDDIPLSNIL